MNEKQQQVLDKAIEMFPDIVSTQVITRPQLKQLAISLNMKYPPSFMMAQPAGRGLYALPNNSVLPSVSVIKNDSKPMLSDTSLVPEIDPTFVPFGNYPDVESVIKAGIFYPCYIYGPTGNGKSTMVEQICATHKKPLIRVNLNMMTDEEQLIGSKTLQDGNVEVVEGPVLVALRGGATLLLDEISAANPNLILCLQSILEGKPYYFKLKNEMVIPADGFNIIATDNTKGKGSDDGRYIGTNILNEAFLERFAVTFEQEYPSANVELKIVKNLMKQFSCVDDEFATTLVKWAEAIRYCNPRR